MRPTVNYYKNNFSGISDDQIKNLLRRDKINSGNINAYHFLIHSAKKDSDFISAKVLNYLYNIHEVWVINEKSYLVSQPNEKAKLKSYLVSKDNVKVINWSDDKRWANIGYVNNKGEPLIEWIKSDAIYLQ